MRRRSTIHSKIAQGGRGSPLNLDIRAFEKEQDRLESGFVDRSHVWMER